MKTKILNGLLLTAALALSTISPLGTSYALAQDAAPAPAGMDELTPIPKAAATSVPVDADPAIWVVKDKDTTIYLFGTVHILKPNLMWFDEAVKTAAGSVPAPKLSGKHKNADHHNSVSLLLIPPLLHSAYMVYHRSR